ncbi:hypothetical protein KKG29_05800 [Patescibacteria group bacterium]|nr:hypothetical protein [Desulfobacteraceae bacterium]MBU4000651.1 hypothetical protein [Patescibacteria group bacterium]
MARQYNPKRFFRQAPNKLLEQYFKEKEVLAEIKFKELTETKIETIYKAWLALPEKQRSDIEKDLREIDCLATEGGTKAIIDEANWHKEELGPIFSELKSFHDRAFWTFLNRQTYWKGALQFHYADTIPASYWRKRKNIPKKPALVESEVIERLEQAISQYFYHKQGRGKNCIVECYRRDDLDYFFAYPEDYAQANIEWIENKFERPPRTPAFEVIFVYSQTDGTLEVFLRSNKKPVPDLQKIFAEIILKTALGPDKKDEKVYHLNPLKQRDFQFVYDPAIGIEDVRVCKLRLASMVGRKERITLEADPTYNPEAVFDLLNKLQNPSMRLSNYNITQLGLKVFFSPATGSLKEKTRCFDITYPNSCNLKQDGRDLIIRKMLAASGLEPKEET